VLRLFGHPACRKGLRAAVVGTAIGGVVVAGWVGVGRLEAHVAGLARADRGDAVVTFVNIPPTVAPLASDSLHRCASPFLSQHWTDDRLCQRIAVAIGENAWVDEVYSVRRTPAPGFEVNCRFRVPAALVQYDAAFYLVDQTGIRLPGAYSYDRAWPLIQGVEAGPPTAGTAWPGRDLRAGIDVLIAVGREPFADQITAVLVDNFDGRQDRLAVHIELATDQSGGRIRWGSAPGAELAENAVSQQRALLRENHRRTGRVDAGHLVIDISTYPDRVRIPG
jgi:hypothetical protein